MESTGIDRTLPEGPAYWLHLNGVVQGVGFRPYVYQMARAWGLHGTVNNGTDGVNIILHTDAETAERFYRNLLDNPPPLAIIKEASIREVCRPVTNDFTIEESEASQPSTLMLTPDFSLCADCRRELHDPTDRRYRYPFITCTQCGPRYSITQRLPYDRPNTTMQPFAMCPACSLEYHDPTHRRFYSQTNSCPICGPRLGWYKSDNRQSYPLSQLHDSRWILPRVKWALESGCIVAVKGIGGYLLLCDATNQEAVRTLRARKHRPTKPLALLYPSLDLLVRDVEVSQQEAEALQRISAPIVLLKRRPGADSLIAEDVAPGLSHLGVMLSYAPLLELIAHDFGKPLVATSGNISGNPIIYTDEKAFAELSSIADYVLTHNREILIPQDDSVIRFTAKHQQQLIIRRGRGLSPNYVASQSATGLGNQLAFGASLKSTFALKAATNLYVSQYLGDLESYDTQENFRKMLAYFLKTCQPAHLPDEAFVSELLADAHEGYFSTQLAQELGKKWAIPVRKVQHHNAHFAAVLAENNVMQTTDAILGVVWDGTGYGTDGHIWGGEFFLKKGVINSIDRIDHFPYFDALLGDKMPREPRLSALSLVKTISTRSELPAYLQSKFTPAEWSFYQKILERNTLKTSSMGRVFDGVASLLGLADKVTFEGEAALRLEEAAGQYLTTHTYQAPNSYWENGLFSIDALLTDIEAGKSVAQIAAQFHLSLVEWVRMIARREKVAGIACSGGVFQNAVLVDLMLDRLEPEFTLYFHRELSPNDECIAFGQLMMSGKDSLN